MKNFEELLKIKKDIIENCEICSKFNEPVCSKCLSRIKITYNLYQANILPPFWNKEIDDLRLRTLLAEFQQIDKILEGRNKFYLLIINGIDEILPILFKNFVLEEIDCYLINFIEIFENSSFENLSIIKDIIGIMNMNELSLENYKVSFLKKIFYNRKYNNKLTIVSTNLNLSEFLQIYSEFLDFFKNRKIINLK